MRRRYARCAVRVIANASALVQRPVRMASSIRLNGGRCAFRLGESSAAGRVSKGFYDRPYVGHDFRSPIVDSSVRRPWRYGCDMSRRWCAVLWGRSLVADSSSGTRYSFSMAHGQIVHWVLVLARRANSALVSDACAAALLRCASCSAAQRGR